MKLLDGKKVSKNIIQEVKQAIFDQHIKPGLAVVLVGDNPASEVYVRRKQKACHKVGIDSVLCRMPGDVSMAELLKTIDELNQDNRIHGILVQLPLPEHIDEEEILRHVDQKKDVDGFHLINTGKLMRGQDALVPCTPAGIIDLLQAYKVKIQGAHALVIGRSNIVGKPMAHLLLGHHATVTIAHSRTVDLPAHCLRSDIIIAAAGVPKMIPSDWVKDGTYLVDVGINRLQDGSLVGDVDFESFDTRDVWVSPVPGGVGPLTIARLLKNTLYAYQRQQ